MARWRAALLLAVLASCGYEPAAPCTRHSDCAPGDTCSARGHCEAASDAAPDGGNEATAP